MFFGLISLKCILFIFLVESGHRNKVIAVYVVTAAHMCAVWSWRDSNISGLHCYCFSDEDSSEGTAGSEFTVEVLHWRYSAQHRWQLPTAFGGEDTLNMKVAVNRNGAWCGDQPPDLTVWLLVPSIQCSSNISQNDTCNFREFVCRWKSLHAELTTVIVPKASELYHLFLCICDY